MNEPREVIMTMGGIGVGKSMGALSIADARSDVFLHYIVADRAIDKLYAHYPEIQNRNVIEYEGFSSKDIYKAIRTITQIALGNPSKHWLVLDTVGQAYKNIQDDISMKYFGVQKGERKVEEKGAIDGFQAWQWSEVKALFYNDIVFPIVRYQKFNVLLIAHTLPIQGAFYNRQVSIVSGDRLRTIGLVPDVHRDILRYLDTALYLSVDNGNYQMQTIKETGTRKHIETPANYAHFWNDYQRLTNA